MNCLAKLGAVSLLVLISACSDLKERQIENIVDLFTLIELDEKATSLPNKFVKKSDSEYISFIDGFEVTIEVHKGKVRGIRAETKYPISKRYAYINKWKQYEAEIIYPLEDKDGISIERTTIGSEKTSKIQYRQNPKRYCYVKTMTSPFVLVNFPSHKDNKMVMHMGHEEGFKGTCDNTAEAIRFGYDYTEETPGFMYIEKKYKR